MPKIHRYFHGNAEIFFLVDTVALGTDSPNTEKKKLVCIPKVLQSDRKSKRRTTDR